MAIHLVGLDTDLGYQLIGEGAPLPCGQDQDGDLIQTDPGKVDCPRCLKIMKVVENVYPGIWDSNRAYNQAAINNPGWDL